MDRYRFTSKREAVNFALQTLADALARHTALQVVDV
jgi:Arc/MetJ family transcription regulator